MKPLIGEIRLFSGDYTVEGWLKCDGQTVNIDDYRGLYGVIGTTYGGDGVTTFKVPDLRGRAPIHTGNGAGLPSYSLGDAGGAAEVTLSQSNLPAHDHTVQVPCSTTAGDRQNPLYANPAVTPDQSYRANSNQGMAPFSTGGTGDGVAVDIRNPYLAMNYLIATVGEFPQSG